MPITGPTTTDQKGHSPVFHISPRQTCRGSIFRSARRPFLIRSGIGARIGIAAIPGRHYGSSLWPNQFGRHLSDRSGWHDLFARAVIPLQNCERGSVGACRWKARCVPNAAYSSTATPVNLAANGRAPRRLRVCFAKWLGSCFTICLAHRPTAPRRLKKRPSRSTLNNGIPSRL